MPTADTDNNILLTTYDGTAVIATDYATSGSGLSLAHLPLSKMAWGSDAQGFRVSEITPLPVQILGVTTGFLGVTFGGISGSVFIRNSPSTYITVGGPSGSVPGYTPVQITGFVQGITNGILQGVTGSVNISGTATVQGVCGGLVGVTGGRRLNSLSDSVTVVGNVGLSGGLALAAANNSVAVWGSDLGTKVLTRLYASDGTTLGYSGNALNVNVVGAGITATISISSIVGVTNGNGIPLMVKGSGISSDSPVLVQGTLSNGALNVFATTPFNVGITGQVEVNDTDIIDSLESVNKPIVSNLSSIKTNTAIISTINNKLSGAGVNTKITDIAKPTTLYSGYKDVTNTTSLISSVSIRLKAGVHLKAPTRNTSAVYIGSNALSTSAINGFPLEPGESIYLEIDNLNKIFVVSSNAGQQINYIAT
jgi:hypothetical protein